MIRPRARLAKGADSGVSIVEVVVALFVFTIIALGVASGAMSITRLTSDARSREVATSLAARDLDEARAVGDPFDVLARTWTQDVSGRSYTVERRTSWVSIAGSDTTCGRNDNYRYRRVTAEVSWTGQLTTTADITSSTVLAPLKQTTDAGTGALSIFVKGADGTARSGVDVKVVPVAGGTGAVLKSQPDKTDVEGCAYASLLTPGSYTVELSKAGYVDTTQAAKPQLVVAVAAGSTAGKTVIYDEAATFTQTLVPRNYTAPKTPLVPNNLDITYTPVDAAYPAATLPWAPSAKLFPFFPSGYTAAAGKTVDPKSTPGTCLSMDPSAWQSKKIKGVQLGPAGQASGVGKPGAPGSFAVPVGIIKVDVPFSLGQGVVFTAKTSSQTEVDGNPGCAMPATYTFDRVAGSTTQYLALPYGSWTITYTIVSGVVYEADKKDLEAVSNVVSTQTSSSGGVATVTLDPRVAS